MTSRHPTALRRSVAALDVLRGRRPRFDWGILIVMPFVAAAGGVLISLAIENAVERRRVPPAPVPVPPTSWRPSRGADDAGRPDSPARDEGRGRRVGRR
jgi:hypothetical protein